MTLDRDTAATDALLTDLYLDALLAGAVLDSAGTGFPTTAAGQLDPAARRAADRLRHELVRVHPSFRFEERLATRLAEAAVAMRVPLAAGDRRIVRFRQAPAGDPAAELAATAAWPDPGGSEEEPAGASRRAPGPGGLDADEVRRGPGRPLIIGGALTSAALSLAGAAFVAWRVGRSGRASTPMARAARAIRSGTPGRQPLRRPRRTSATSPARGLD